MKLMILDGNSILNRAFYGIKLLATPDGLYTNAVFGFLNIMERMRSEEQPDALCVTFDLKAPTFRHLRYEGYKATRHPMPEELVMQLPLIREVLQAMNIPILEAEGWEADDILGTVGRLCAEQGQDCVIVTGDRDSLQLVAPHVFVKLIISKPGSTTATLYDEALFREEYGFAPKGLIDLKALMGDSSDNIPGVPGVGKKTAGDLLQKYGSLDEVYAHLDDQRDSLRNKLLAGKESAYLSYELATIVPNAPVEFCFDNCVRPTPDKKALRAVFEKLQFFKMMNQYGLNQLDEEEASEEAAAPAQERTVLEELPTAEGAVALFLSGNQAAVANEKGTWVGDAAAQELPQCLSKAAPLICCDYKQLLRELDALGLPRPQKVFDCALAGYVLDPAAASYSVDKLSERYLTRQPGTDPAALAEALLELYPELQGRMEREELLPVYEEIDLPLCAVLADMEEAGALVDRNQLEQFRVMLTERISALEEQIYEIAGEPFNINSTKKLGEILFEKLELPIVKKTKTGYSTNAEVLEKLRPLHPIADAILEYRQLTKLHSTYAEGLLKVIAEDGRIHTTFQNMVTATGRLSSTDPNLQNIPVRTELGSEIRKMFIAKPGYVLVDADYSQIELRVLAHIADDAAMQEAFLSGEDFHTVTASQVFNVPIEQVTPLMRRNAKAVNFGIVYGITKWSLSEDLHITPYEAGEYIDSYLARFSGVRNYMKSVIDNARLSGFTSTLYGRKRKLPELKSSNFAVRSGAERMALNTPVQGTAADIMKLAMLRVHEALPKVSPSARLILQVHDELIVECPAEDAEAVKAMVSSEMQQAANLAVPLLAEANSGANWYEAK